jgi:hypothetical protein
VRKSDLRARCCGSRLSSRQYARLHRAQQPLRSHRGSCHQVPPRGVLSGSFPNIHFAPLPRNLGVTANLAEVPQWNRLSEIGG